MYAYHIIPSSLFIRASFLVKPFIQATNSLLPLRVQVLAHVVGIIGLKFIDRGQDQLVLFVTDVLHRIFPIIWFGAIQQDERRPVNTNPFPVLLVVPIDLEDERYCHLLTFLSTKLAVTARYLSDLFFALP